MIPFFGSGSYAANIISGNISILKDGGLSGGITNIPADIDGIKLSIVSGGGMDGKVPLMGHVSNDLPPYIRGGGLFQQPPVGYIGNEPIYSRLSVISGENEGHVHLDNLIYDDLPVFRSYNISSSEDVVAEMSASCNVVSISSDLPLISGELFTGSSINSLSTVIDGEIYGKVGIGGKVSGYINVVSGELHSGHLILGDISVLSKNSYLSGNISATSKIEAILPPIRGSLVLVSDVRSNINNKLAVIRGSLISGRYSHGSIEAYLPVINGNMVSFLSTMSSMEDCFGIPVITGKMYQELKNKGKIIDDLAIIDRCSELKFYDDEEGAVLRHVRGKVR